VLDATPAGVLLLLVRPLAATLLLLLSTGLLLSTMLLAALATLLVLLTALILLLAHSCSFARRSLGRDYLR
jgi:hypothetical protein